MNLSSHLVSSDERCYDIYIYCIIICSANLMILIQQDYKYMYYHCDDLNEDITYNKIKASSRNLS